jgi:hypothetical protein
MRRRWRKVDDALFAAVIGGRDGAQYHVIAERLPNGDGWDWTAWRPGDAPAAARHGVVTSAVEAMRAAEAAVRHWDDATAPGV